MFVKDLNIDRTEQLLFAICLQFQSKLSRGKDKLWL